MRLRVAFVSFPRYLCKLLRSIVIMNGEYVVLLYDMSHLVVVYVGVYVCTQGMEVGMQVSMPMPE